MACLMVRAFLPDARYTTLRWRTDGLTGRWLRQVNHSVIPIESIADQLPARPKRAEILRLRPHGISSDGEKAGLMLEAVADELLLSCEKAAAMSS